MPYIVAYDEVKANRRQRDLPKGHSAWSTHFIVSSENEDAPQAFLAESTPGRVLGTHFHEVDQFQVIVKGSGTLGKHRLAPHGVHFARAYTPYGPIANGEEGIGFLTLRVHKDRGRAQHLPGARAKLESVTSRNPWQVTELAQFIEHGGADIYEFSRIKDDRGLGAFSVKLKPDAALSAPDPSQTEGQYVVITKGSLIHDNREYKALSLALVKPEEGPMRLVAGTDGLEALVLNYPRLQSPGITTVPVRSHGYRVWQCALCAFSYDEALGMPEEGIAAGTRWEDVPETWSCPDCSAGKTDFQMELVPTSPR